jgi:hypothetical protein
MVDALRRAHRMVRPGGCVIDVHPTAAPATVEIGQTGVGEIDTVDAPRRHAAAIAALARAVEDRLFVIDHMVDFAFYTYGDSIEELRDYVLEQWVEAQIAPALVARARDALRAAPGARARLRELVRLNTLRPLFRDPPAAG